MVKGMGLYSISAGRLPVFSTPFISEAIFPIVDGSLFCLFIKDPKGWAFYYFIDFFFCLVFPSYFLGLLLHPPCCFTDLHVCFCASIILHLSL